MEYKAAQQFTKAITDRTVVGVFAVHGNIDAGGDRSHPGSFADTKVDGRDRVRFLWQHDSSAPPIAVIDYVRELPRDRLPEKVLGFAPDASGGVEVSRTYLDTPRGNEVLAGITAGAIQEMSYAYDLTNYAFTEEEDRTVREIYGVKLFDISDVNHGMNPATSAVKAVDWKEHSLTAHADAVEAANQEFFNRIQELMDRRAKEGRILSDANRKKIEGALQAMSAVQSALQDLLTASAPKCNEPEARRLLLEWQRNVAILNGASISL